MKDNKLVTAIITTHNRKQLLMKAIESVLNQTYSPIECIVIDDASTDGTRDYIADYIANHSVRYIYIKPEQSKGGNYARNIGIRVATGDYIAFCDDDDEWFSDKIEKQVKVMSDTVGFVYCGVVVERDFDISTRVNRPNNPNKYFEGDLLNKILSRSIVALTTTIMVKSAVIRDIGGFDEKLNYWQEYELCIRILQNTYGGAVKENLVLYRDIKKDKNRLSNRIKGWEYAVEYIENKHCKSINNLSIEEKVIRKMYIYIDGFLRGYNAGNIQYMFKYALCMVKDAKIRKQLIGKVYTKIKGCLYKR